MDNPVMVLMRVGMARKRVNQTALANYLGLHKNTVSRWMKGQGKPEHHIQRWGPWLGWDAEDIGRALTGVSVVGGEGE